MAEKWTRIVLKGRSQVIPALCPNCLGAADQKFRYGYKGLEGWLTRTTYYQTFTYCQACLPQAKSASGLRGWAYFSGVLGFIAMIPLIIVFSDALRDPVTKVVPGFMGGLAASAAILLAAGLGALLYLGIRTLKRRRHPGRPEQAVWGLAAFYTGGTHLGFNTGNAVYKAARREWVAALARANPDQVEEAVYQDLVGTPRPVVTQDRPFGPA